MRQCPQCGYIDPPVWRHVRYRMYTDYCRIDELENWDQTLYALLKQKLETNETKDFPLGHYIYHFVKGNVIVQRIHVSDSRDGKTHREPEQEKLKNWRIVNPAQSKLLGEA